MLTIFAKNTRELKNLMNTSKGRDKFCQLIQYFCTFYTTCMKESDVYGPLVKQKAIKSVLKMKSMENNISSGRKIFRLLKFIDEFEELNNAIHNKDFTPIMRRLKILSSICSFFYFLFDNIIWLY
jgi:hypothetical protein